MTLFPHSSVDPRDERQALADVLRWYGAIGDATVGHPPGFALRKASLAHDLAEIAQLSESDARTLYIAGMLNAVGAIGSPAFRKGEMLSERVSFQERWDVPARGARFAASILSLPPDAADMIRWQNECWDGTGFPDQLRWHGIPAPAQLLSLADAFLQNPDPEDALGAIGMQSGRAFGPAFVRIFTMWFHRSGGEVHEREFPLDALEGSVSAESVIDAMADAIDAHNGVPGRWRRVATLAMGAADGLSLDDDARSRLGLACRIFGAGEATRDAAEDDQFDPLARLGIDTRAANAATSAALARGLPTFASAAEVTAARAEWFDGTGKPRGIKHGEISRESAILAAAIAYDRLDRGERLEDAAGTQFDPAVVRAMMESRAHA